MKSALLTGLKALVNQVKENVFETAKRTVERQGYQVVKPTNKKENK